MTYVHLSQAMGAQCSTATCRGGQQSPAEELRAYMVLGVIDKVSLGKDGLKGSHIDCLF